MRKAHLLGLLAATALMGGGNHSGFGMIEPEVIDPEEVKRKEENRKISLGLKKYIINGVEVWARNQKNAIRKAKNKTK